MISTIPGKRFIKKLRRVPLKVRATSAKIILLKFYSWHGNFLNVI